MLCLKIFHNYVFSKCELVLFYLTYIIFVVIKFQIFCGTWLDFPVFPFFSFNFVPSLSIFLMEFLNI